MKFDAVLMNPPYNRNLHLQILSKVIDTFPEAEIVNLSPIRWLQDPLAEYKKNSDWKKFEKIRKRMTSLEEISAVSAQRLFSSGQYENLGIYCLTKEGGLNITVRPFISQQLFDKVNMQAYNHKIGNIYDLLSEWNSRLDFSKPFVKISVLHGNVGHKTWADIITPQRDIAMSQTSKGKMTGTYTVNFDSTEEANNFFDFLNLTFMKACNANVKTCIRWPGYAIPEFSNVKWTGKTGTIDGYKNPITDDMLYEYFGITDEERAEIEKTMEKYSERV